MLLAADGVSNTEIASRAEVSRPTVIAWRARYDSSGLAGWSIVRDRVDRAPWITARSSPRR